jgi:hypothetical protein
VRGLLSGFDPSIYDVGRPKFSVFAFGDSQRTPSWLHVAQQELCWGFNASNIDLVVFQRLGPVLRI